LLTLGVGIGSNVALFSVLRGVLIRPLPYPEAERLVRMWEANPGVDDQLHGPSPWNFADWQREAPGFESMAAWYLTSGTYRDGDYAEEIRSAQVTADFFRVMGREPMLGRDFRPEEVTTYGPVMLSYGLWQRLFGGDSTVVGRSMISSGNSYEIIGVMPPDFVFPDESVESWVAWDLPGVYEGNFVARTWRFLDGIGRLEDGTSLEVAEQGLDSYAARLAEAYPVENEGWGARLTSLHDEVIGDTRATLWIAFGAVLFILLIACANVANLLLARVPSRSRELAIRSTLGAPRGRIVGELLAESLLLAGLAGLTGLVIGQVLLRTLVAFDAGRIPRLGEVSIDGWVIVFTLTISGLTAVLFGLAPALQALGGSAMASLRDGTRTTGSAAHRRLRELFVGSQVAVAIVLLSGAALFVTSFAQIRGVDPGLDPANVATFRISLDPVEGTDGEIFRYYEGLMTQLEALPGVVRAGAAQTLPLNPIGNDFRRPYRPVGSALEVAEAPEVQMRIVTSGYVDAMGMRLVAGENLPRSAAAGEPLVALVNRTLAEELWPNQTAVGQTFEIDFRVGWQPYLVTGIVEDVKHYGLREASRAEVFLSHRQSAYLAMSIVVRTAGDPDAMAATLRQAVLEHQPVQPAHNFVSMETLLSASIAEERFLMVLLGTFTTIALLLAASGIYGVISYVVSHQQREIGVRMALGADRTAVVRGVLVRSIAVTAVGLVAGLIGVAVMGGFVESVLFGVTASDPRASVGVAAVVGFVATVAAYLPARRAASVTPVTALRSD
jgi:predicted permease